MNPAYKKTAIVSLTVGLLLSGLIYWLSTLFYWAEEEVDHGFSKAAIQNDFLAAKLFLQQQGIPVSVVKNQQLLKNGSWRNIELKQNDTIILVNAYKTLDEERYERLSDWVEAGGTLIASSQNPFVGSHTKQNDLLLDDFSIEQAPRKVEEEGDFFEELSKDLKKKEKELEEENKKDKEDEAKEKESKNPEKTAADIKKRKQKEEYWRRCGKKKDTTEVKFSSEDKPLIFDFSYEEKFIYYDYDDLDDEGLAKEHPEHMLYFNWGDGAVTFLSDTYIWSNRRIDCHDHAYALWHSVNPDGRVWILVNQDAPSLFAIIWQKVPYGLLACILALCLWLWNKSQTLGPVFVQQTIARRSLAEHLYASGVLLWRKFQSPQLLVVLRKEILELLEKHHQLHSWQADASGQMRLDFLHELTGLPQDAIKHALFADGIHEPQDLARVIANLQIIRKHI